MIGVNLQTHIDQTPYTYFYAQNTHAHVAFNNAIDISRHTTTTTTTLLFSIGVLLQIYANVPREKMTVFAVKISQTYLHSLTHTKMTNLISQLQFSDMENIH